VTIGERADDRSVIGSPKSATSRRTIPLGETATRALEEWRLAQPSGRPLLLGTRNHRPDNQPTCNGACPLEERAGVPHHGWHALRHYAISSRLAAGVDPKTVQYWAGHSKPTMTLDTYGHMIPRQDDHARINTADSALLG